MSDDKSKSIINFGDLSKPAATLIEKVSSAVGGIFEPWQIKRVAKAEAEVNLIKAKSEIEIIDLQQRATRRFLNEQVKYQNNMEEITKKSLPHLSEKSKPENMEDDWVTNFFDKSRIVSDEKMQIIWSNILASEANSAGSFSKRTVNLLGDLDKRDAELFQELCRFGGRVAINEFHPLIFDCQSPIYNELGIDFASLSHLDSLGLIRFDPVSGFSVNELPKNFSVIYDSQTLSLEMSNDKDNSLEIGMVILSKAGKELAQVVKSPRVDGFYDYIKDKWKEHIPPKTALN